MRAFVSDQSGAFESLVIGTGLMHIDPPTRYHHGIATSRQSGEVMQGQERYELAEEFAGEARRVLGQRDGKDTAVWSAAVAAAIDAAFTGRERPEIPASWIVPPGLPRPRLPGVGPLPGP